MIRTAAERKRLAAVYLEAARLIAEGNETYLAERIFPRIRTLARFSIDGKSLHFGGGFPDGEEGKNFRVLVALFAAQLALTGDL